VKEVRLLPHWVRVFFFCAAALCALAPAARAHDPYDAFTSATLHPDRLELIFTIATSTAVRLIDSEASLPALTPAHWPELRPRFQRTGATLFELTTKDAPLIPRAVAVELSDENDLIFHIVYPRPEAGNLVFYAAYLKKLGDGYGSILDFNDPSGRNLGWEQLLWAHPDFTATLPP
jgi:hypothetical protein